MRHTFFIALPLLLISGTVSAQQKSLGTFGVWQAFSYKEKDQTICYMAKTAKFPADTKAKAKSKTKSRAGRGPAFLMITHRPDENTRDVVSYASGYNFKPGSDVKMQFGKQSFDLFTNKDTAWSRDTKTDHAIAAAITSHPQVKISALPENKALKNTTDTLDLTGSAQAYKAINVACGYETEPTAKPKKTPKKAKK